MAESSAAPGVFSETHDERRLTPRQLLAMLDQFGIEHRSVEHEPLYTVVQSKAIRADPGGGHTKNLFLRNKKGSMWLVTCHEDRAIDLKSLGTALGGGRLSFCSESRLDQCLGVIPGAVSPFAVVHDQRSVVRMVLERNLLEYDRLHLHPLANTMTTTIAATDLVRFLEAVAHPPELMELS